MVDRQIPAHVRHLDPLQWPALVTVPATPRIAAAARREESKFADLCDLAAIALVTAPPVVSDPVSPVGSATAVSVAQYLRLAGQNTVAAEVSNPGESLEHSVDWSTGDGIAERHAGSRRGQSWFHRLRRSPKPRPATPTNSVKALLSGKQPTNERGEPVELFPLTVHVAYEELFYRLADAGWVGLGEAYAAGEFYVDNVAEFLARLIALQYAPGKGSKVAKAPAGSWDGAELPVAVAAACSGGGGMVAPIYSSGVPTTVRAPLPTARRRAGQARFIDRTTITAPVAVEADDVRFASRRGAQALARLAGVHPGSDVLDWPAIAPTMAQVLLDLGATVDAITADPLMADWLERAVGTAHLSGRFQVITADEPYPSNQGRYDHLISVGRLERLSTGEQRTMAQTMAKLLSPSGTAAIQAQVVTDTFSSTAQQAQRLLHYYLYPNSSPLTVGGLVDTIESVTDLRTRAITHIGSHLETTAAIYRSNLLAQADMLAAHGIDEVTRRMMDYVLALQQALAALEMLDVVQLQLTHQRQPR
ncbi:SAM-dependent methyltransferase [Corynebacterium choanae]|uniref:Cyclopropane fatty acyl phospholipid synthase n=1 Tax=Corynebacterium choanae TaxID=1862358 RepID=A0A3G6J611_9CORY|nr:class I SAM-dependent methyltransferase [Corynebacterium choanae]AZA13535.1 cyclopropane fatty acyl phospholipid synthase [Corynebacterium choanae]